MAETMARRKVRIVIEVEVDTPLSEHFENSAHGAINKLRAMFRSEEDFPEKVVARCEGVSEEVNLRALWEM